MRTTVDIDDKIHELAKKHGINLARTARRAITAKAEQAERDEQILQKLRNNLMRQTAILLPLDDDEIFQNDSGDTL